MSDNELEVRRVAWSSVLPWVRLFHSLRLALHPGRMLLALAGILLMYLGGSILAGVWGARNGVVVETAGDHVYTEIDAFAQKSRNAYGAWRERAVAQRDDAAARALVNARRADDADAARRALASHSLSELLVDKQFREELPRLRKLVRERVSAGLAAIDDEKGADTDKQARREELADAGDALVILLTPEWRGGAGIVPDQARLVRPVVAADPKIERQQQNQDRDALWAAITRVAGLREWEQLRPRGVFHSLLTFESRCFGAAVDGLCAGRWGFGGNALDAEPSMAGSIVSALRGLMWLVTERPVFAVVLGLWSLLVFSLFGGAVCRSAAVQSAREESISLGAAFGFAWNKLGAFAGAPLIPLAGCALVGVLLFIGGLVGWIPYLGELLVGSLYGLALLAGFAVSVVVLVMLVAFHLVWPTIAVEGSDSLDALTRACSYVTGRIWHVAFYTVALLLYGGAAFVVVRLIAALALKVAHTGTKWSMNFASSANLEGVGKLDAMWRMPAWSDLSLLPSAGAVNYWGTFDNAPLDGAESLSLFFLRCWVYLVVGLVGAFVVNFFLCGSTQAYFLLRREVDATDFDDVYYEEPAGDEDLFPAAIASEGLANGSLTPPSMPEPPPPPPPAS